LRIPVCVCVNIRGFWHTVFEHPETPEHLSTAQSPVYTSLESAVYVCGVQLIY